MKTIIKVLILIGGVVIMTSTIGGCNNNNPKSAVRIQLIGRYTPPITGWNHVKGMVFYSPDYEGTDGYFARKKYIKNHNFPGKTNIPLARFKGTTDRIYFEYHLLFFH